MSMFWLYETQESAQFQIDIINARVQELNPNLTFGNVQYFDVGYEENGTTYKYGFEQPNPDWNCEATYEVQTEYDSNWRSPPEEI